MIHPTSIVDSSVIIEDGVRIDAFAYVGKNSILKSGVHIMQSAYVENCQLQENVEVYPYAIIGTLPQDLKFYSKGDVPSRVIIGKNTKIREFVTVHRATKENGITSVGDNCFIMAYAHIAHDCFVGNEVIMANVATLAGHVEVGDFAVLSGLCAVHQYTKIGKLAMIGGGAMVNLDVPPFMIAEGNRARIRGINIVGLQRKNFSDQQISNIKECYRILYNSNLTLEQSLKEISKLENEEAKILCDFIKKTKRGIARE